MPPNRASPVACSEHHPFLGHPGTSRSMSRISRMAGSAYKQHHTKCNMLSADYQELCLADSITHDGAHHAIFILVLISHLSSCQYAWTSNLERDMYSEQTMYSRQRQLCLSGSAFLHSLRRRGVVLGDPGRIPTLRDRIAADPRRWDSPTPGIAPWDPRSKVLSTQI